MILGKENGTVDFVTGAPRSTFNHDINSGFSLRVSTSSLNGDICQLSCVIQK